MLVADDCQAFVPYCGGFLSEGIGKPFAVLGDDGFLGYFQLEGSPRDDAPREQLAAHKLAYLGCEDRILGQAQLHAVDFVQLFVASLGFH